jgi:hypothetical protein
MFTPMNITELRDITPIEPVSTVSYLLKARAVEPEKKPLLVNGSETTFVFGQRPRNRQRNDDRC